MPHPKQPKFRPLILRRLLAGGLIVLLLFGALVVLAIQALRIAATDRQILNEEFLTGVTQAHQLQIAIDQAVRLQLQAMSAERAGELQTLHDRAREDLERLQQSAANLTQLSNSGDLRSAVHAAVGELILRNATLVALRTERLELRARLSEQMRPLDRYLRPLGPAPLSAAAERCLLLLMAMSQAPSELTLRRLSEEVAVQRRQAFDLPEELAQLVGDTAGIASNRAALLDLERRLHALERQQAQIAERLQALTGTVTARAEQMLTQQSLATNERQDRLSAELGAACILCLGTLAVLWIALRRGVIDRLHSLAQTINAWQSGQRDPPEIGGNDEIAAVAYAVESFVERIDQQTQILSENEHRLAVALHEAEQASRAKSIFLASMSHELRTPLNAIIGFTELMQTGIGGTLTERHIEYTRMIHDSGTLLLSLINDILDFSKLQAGQRNLEETWEDPVALAASAVQMMQPALERRHLRIDLTTPNHYIELFCDARGLRQMLLNLLSNAVKFSPDGGLVRVVMSLKQGDLLIEIIDQGPGVPLEKLDQIFQPFTQLQDDAAKSGHGTGLGLVIVRSLAQLHEGTAWLESAPGRGATACIRLPASRLRQPGPLVPLRS